MCITSIEIKTGGSAHPHARRKITDIDSHFHCSIAGTCLTLDETRRILVRSGIEITRGTPDYEIHAVAVNALARGDGISQTIGKTLDAKFSRMLEKFPPDEGDEAVMARWRECYSRGEIPAAYWAVMTHPGISDRLKAVIFGEVHMLSHINGAATRNAIDELNAMRNRCAVLEREKRAYRRRIGELNKNLEGYGAVRLERDRMRVEISGLKLAILAHRGDPTENELRDEIRECLDRLGLEKSKVEKCESRIRTLEENLLRVETENKSLRDKLRCMTCPNWRHGALSADNLDGKPQEAITTRNDLSKKRILYIGGKSASLIHCRRLVEEGGGRFSHHDGGIEHNIKNLPSVLRGADAVFCPVDCVSHNACLILKKICRHHGTRFVMLRSSGFTSFAKSVYETFGAGIPTGAG